MDRTLMEELKSDDKHERLQAISRIPAGSAEEYVHILVDSLRDPYWPVRERAAKTLVGMGPKVCSYLVEAMASSNADMRFWSAWILGQIGGEEAARLLINSFSGNEDHEANLWASKALVNIGQPAVPLLLEALRAPESDLRFWAAYVLGEFNNSEVEIPLTALLSDPEWRVRMSAARALGKIGTEKAIDPLISSLNDPSWHVRKSATESLGKIKDRLEMARSCGAEKVPSSEDVSSSLASYQNLIIQTLARTLEDEEEHVRTAGMKLLSEIGSNLVVDPLIKILSDPASSLESIFVAVKALRKIHAPGAVDKLSSILEKHDNPDLARECIKTLASTGTPEAIAAIRKVLENPQIQLKKDAMIELARTGAPESIQDVARNLNDENAEIREAAAVALGVSKRQEALPYLFELVEDPEPGVRKAALESLVRIQGADAADEVIRLIEDRSDIVARKAINLLGTLKDTNGIGALVRTVRSRNRELQFLAIQVLGILGEPAVPALLELLDSADRDQKFWTLSTLEKNSAKGALPKLLEVLSDSDNEICLAALKAIKAQDDPAPPEPLLALLEENRGKEIILLTLELLSRYRDEKIAGRITRFLESEDKDIRFFAASILGQVALPSNNEVIGALIEALSDRHWPVRKVSAESLGKLGSAVVPVLLPLLDEGNPDRSYWVVKALGEIGDPVCLERLKKELMTSDTSQKINVIRSIGKFNDEKAHRILVEILGDRDREARFHAAKALKDVKSEFAMKPLITALNDSYENVRYWAAKALGNYDHPDVVTALNRALSDESHWVHKYAAESLERIRERQSMSGNNR